MRRMDLTFVPTLMGVDWQIIGRLVCSPLISTHGTNQKVIIGISVVFGAFWTGWIRHDIFSLKTLIITFLQKIGLKKSTNPPIVDLY